MEQAEQNWFTCDLDRRTLKALMRRDDTTALVRFALWFGAVVGSGTLAFLALGGPWVVPAFLLYGTLLAFAEPVAHECSHGTAFRSRWLNETVYLIVGLMALKERPCIVGDTRATTPTRSCPARIPRSSCRDRSAHGGSPRRSFACASPSCSPRRRWLMRSAGSPTKCATGCRPANTTSWSPGRACIWPSIWRSSPGRRRSGAGSRSDSSFCRGSMAPGCTRSSPSPSMPAWPRTCATIGATPASSI